MKWSILYSAALLLLAGCTADPLTEGEAGGRVPIGVSVSGTGDDTRAGTHIQKSQFDAGETFNVYFASGADTETAQFTTVNTVGETTSAGASPCFLESATEAVMHAYYPQTVSNLTKSFTVQQNQIDSAGFKQSDLMYATTTATKSGKSVTAPLLFEHKMAKIVAMVTAGDSVQKIYTVRIVGGYRTISITDGKTCTLGTSYNDPNSTSDYITMYDNTEGATEVICAAMLPPQDINEDFLEIVTDNGTYLSALTKVLQGSHTYNLAVVVGAAKKTTGDGGGESTPDADGMVYTSDVISIDPVDVTYTYCGVGFMPATKVRKKSNGEELVEGSDYQLAYVNNVNAGTATIVAVGLGGYTGHAVSTTFKIKKANASISYSVKHLEKSVIDNAFTNPLTNTGDGEVGYASSNTSVATVNRMGKVTILGTGTTTITATVSEGRNYTYNIDDNPNTSQNIVSVQYTITVGQFTLDALKNWVNDNNTSSRYYGYYVNKNGNVHANYVTGDIGRIGYYAPTDVDDNISGSRILILALNNVGNFIWGSKGTARNVTSSSGYANTKRLQAYGSSLHPAAYAAWHYYVDQPEGASNWFLPSISQWNNMMVTAQMSGTGTIAYGDSYWSSEESTADKAWSVTAAGSSTTSQKTDVYTVRPCFAY